MNSFGENLSRYSLFSSSKEWIRQLLLDIQQAKRYIYIETFRFVDDEVGQGVAEKLIQKAQEGVEVKMVVDSWGTRKTALFTKMEAAGISVRFFKKIVISLLLCTKNHERNHRKIVVIDDEISYIGSANFSKYSFRWRESVLRIYGEIGTIFKDIFLDSFKNYKKKLKSREYYKTINYKEFKIIREAPSIRHQETRKYFNSLIKNAQKSITIITPYFLPGKTIRSNLVKVAKKGVRTQVIIPQKSDVVVVDYMRNFLLGSLHKNGVKIYFFQPGNIHAKLILVDNKLFSIGSSNFDYRSFRYMYEINLSGENSEIVALVADYIDETLEQCAKFDLETWGKRSFWEILVAVILIPFRKLL